MYILLILLYDKFILNWLYRINFLYIYIDNQNIFSCITLHQLYKLNKIVYNISGQNQIFSTYTYLFRFMTKCDTWAPSNNMIEKFK